MFELSVACKYLIPRRRQMSVSIISLISILVITLVVWLIVVFFSVTDGLEKNWINKLTALTAPVRITPTEAYYNSYYYQVDSLSDATGYSHKTIGQKRATPPGDPYDPNFDQELPADWPLPDLHPGGTLKDLVHEVFESLRSIKNVPNLSARDFELTASHIHLKLIRDATLSHAQNIYGSTTQSFLNYPTYLGNFEADNPQLDQILRPLTAKDLSNYYQLLDRREKTMQGEGSFSPPHLQKRLHNFFNSVQIETLIARPSGWTIPRPLLPQEARWQVLALMKDQNIQRIVVATDRQHLAALRQMLEEQGMNVAYATLELNQAQNSLIFEGEKPAIFVIPSQEPAARKEVGVKDPDEGIALAIAEKRSLTDTSLQPAGLSDEIMKVAEKPIPLNPHLPITLEGGASLKATLIPESLEQARKLSDVKYIIEVQIQGSKLRGMVTYRGLEFGKFHLTSGATPLWVHKEGATYILPTDPDAGEGILLPKSFRDAGVLLGDRGQLSYLAPTPSTLQEQYVPVYVAGFYDPGIIPIGGKFVLANSAVTSLIRASHQLDDKSTLTNGINVRFDHIQQADEVKKQLTRLFQDKGISRYWTIETYKEYEFTKAIIQELHSQKSIFMLIAVVIILVACSNIISMLIILVNDKKVEIGILRSMGASTKSIAFIFGLAGMAIGTCGSLLGIVTALLTLQNMGILIAFLSSLQGYEVFNASFYGEVLPHEVSSEALFFVIGATLAISLIAAIVPAVKACLLKPSHTLRSSGA